MGRICTGTQSSRYSRLWTLKAAPVSSFLVDDRKKCSSRVLSAVQCFLKASFSGAMPAVSQRQPADSKLRHRRHSSQKASSPDASIQLPQLPKQLEGKFVRGQMYKHQDSLPRLPVPPLEQTLKKYVEGIQV